MYLHDITQAYIQSSPSLYQQFYIQLPKEFKLQNSTVIKVIKLLYNVSKAKAYWFNTYQTHHINKLSIIEFTYDFCLFYINGNDISFKVVGLQTDNTLTLADNIFVATKEKKLKKTKLLAKDKKKLILHTLIKLNEGYIKLIYENSNFLFKKSIASIYIL